MGGEGEGKGEAATAATAAATTPPPPSPRPSARPPAPIRSTTTSGRGRRASALWIPLLMEPGLPAYACPLPARWLPAPGPGLTPDGAGSGPNWTWRSAPLAGAAASILRREAGQTSGWQASLASPSPGLGTGTARRGCCGLVPSLWAWAGQAGEPGARCHSGARCSGVTWCRGRHGFCQDNLHSPIGEPLPLPLPLLRGPPRRAEPRRLPPSLTSPLDSTFSYQKSSF